MTRCEQIEKKEDRLFAYIKRMMEARNDWATFWGKRKLYELRQAKGKLSLEELGRAVTE